MNSSSHRGPLWQNRNASSLPAADCLLSRLKDLSGHDRVSACGVGVAMSGDELLAGDDVVVQEKSDLSPRLAQTLVHRFGN